MITKVIALLVILIVIPYCMGLLPASFIDDDDRDIVVIYVMGFIMSLAIFELVTVPIIINAAEGFPLVVGLNLGLEAAFAVIGITVFNFRVRNRKGNNADEYGKQTYDILKLTKTPTADTEKKRHDWRKSIVKLFRTDELFVWLPAALVMIFQIVMYIRMESFDGDDAYYVVQSLLTGETDTLYRIKPYTGLSTGMDLRHALASIPVWIAYLARVSGIHSTIIAHSVIGILLIPVVYCIYYNCARMFFGKDYKRIGAFMLFISLMYLFGNVSIYTRETFMLTRTWQGKSMLANIVFGAIVWLMTAIFKAGEEEEERQTLGYWIVLFMLSIVAAMCSTAGVFLVALAIAAYGITLAVFYKDAQIALRLMITCVPLAAYGTIYMLM